MHKKSVCLNHTTFDVCGAHLYLELTQCYAVDLHCHETVKPPAVINNYDGGG